VGEIFLTFLMDNYSWWLLVTAVLILIGAFGYSNTISSLEHYKDKESGDSSLAYQIHDLKKYRFGHLLLGLFYLYLLFSFKNIILILAKDDIRQIFFHIFVFLISIIFSAYSLIRSQKGIK
jgi:hypothetical protein